MQPLHTLRFAFLFTLAAAAGGCAAPTEDDGLVDTGAADVAEVAGRPYFELLSGGDGQIYFHLASTNHEVLLASEGYTSRTGALNGVLSVLDHAGFRGNYEVRSARDGSRYFVLQAGNGRVIGTSELYATRAAADRGVAATIAAVAAYLEHMSVRAGARFELFEGRDRQRYFHLRARNGAIVLQSEGYSSEAAALNGAFSVADNGTDAARYDLVAAADGGTYLRLRARNGQTIAVSEVYATRASATRARDAIMALLPTVELL